jgi:hypothetical protein
VKWGFPVGLVSGIVLGVVGATYGTPHISREALSAAPLTGIFSTEPSCAESSGEDDCEPGRHRPQRARHPDGGRQQVDRGAGRPGEQAHCPEAVERLAALMRSNDERVSLAACVAIIERGYGKPEQRSDSAVGPQVRSGPRGGGMARASRSAAASPAAAA